MADTGSISGRFGHCLCFFYVLVYYKVIYATPLAEIYRRPSFKNDLP